MHIVSVDLTSLTVLPCIGSFSPFCASRTPVWDPCILARQNHQAMTGSAKYSNCLSPQCFKRILTSGLGSFAVAIQFCWKNAAPWPAKPARLKLSSAWHSSSKAVSRGKHLRKSRQICNHHWLSSGERGGMSFEAGVRLRIYMCWQPTGSFL